MAVTKKDGRETLPITRHVLGVIATVHEDTYVNVRDFAVDNDGDDHVSLRIGDLSLIGPLKAVGDLIDIAALEISRIYSERGQREVA